MSAESTYLVKGARLLGGDPTDLLLRGGVVAEVGTGLESDGAQVVDATGLPPRGRITAAHLDPVADRLAPGVVAPAKRRRPAPGAYGEDYTGPRGDRG